METREVSLGVKETRELMRIPRRAPGATGRGGCAACLCPPAEPRLWAGCESEPPHSSAAGCGAAPPLSTSSPSDAAPPRGAGGDTTRG